MELIKQKCPSCQANIEIDATRKEAFCQYCGTKILISGMQSSNILGQPVADERLVDMLEAVTPLMEENEKLSASVAQKEASIKDEQDEINKVIMHDNTSLYKASDTDHYKKILIALGVAILLFIISFLLNGLFLVSIPAVIVTGYLVYGNTKITENTEYIERLEGELSGLRDTLAKKKQELSKYNIDAIPAKYRASSILKFFISVLNDQRATNVSQAINLYEDDQRNKKNEAIQRQQMQQIQQLTKQVSAQNAKIQAQQAQINAQNAQLRRK